MFRAGQIDMSQTRKIRTALHSNILVFKILRKKVVFFNELWVFFGPKLKKYGKVFTEEYFL